MTPFQHAVYNVVRLIPVGMVASYSQVAAYVGTPRAARQVGWALRSLGALKNYPWWRVVNNHGEISIHGNEQADAQLQKELLEAEGIAVDNDYRLNIEAHRFRPDASTLARLKLDPDYIQKILAKYDMI